MLPTSYILWLHTTIHFIILTPSPHPHPTLPLLHFQVHSPSFVTHPLLTHHVSFTFIPHHQYVFWWLLTIYIQSSIGIKICIRKTSCKIRRCFWICWIRLLSKRTLVSTRSSNCFHEFSRGYLDTRWIVSETRIDGTTKKKIHILSQRMIHAQVLF